MKRVLATVAVLVVVAVAVPAAAGSLEVRIGAFIPRAQSLLFEDTADLYDTETSDWTGVTGGLEYRQRLAETLEVGVHLDGYSRELHTSYREFVRDSGGEIRQTLKLTTAPLGVTLRFVPGDRHAAIQPYLGAGVDIVFWEYEEFGSFIDFFDDDEIVEFDSFISDGAAPAAHVAGGLRVALSPDIGLSAEARYLFAGKVEMGDDFRGSELDLAGASATLGFFVNF
jgi:opacity protein-like surface antigen